MQKANVLISKSDSRMKNAGTKKAPFQGLCGVPGATRTPGLPLRRRSLYPTELREHGLWGVAQGECTSSALGGDRSIRLSYGNICNLSRTVRSPSFAPKTHLGCQIGCHFGQSPIVTVRKVRDLGLFPRSSSERANARKANALSCCATGT